MSVAVLGAGAFGTALAISLAGNGPVRLWARDPDAVREMRLTRENPARLPGKPLPDALEPTEDLREAAQAGALLLALPTQRLRGFLTDHRDLLDGKRLVACCKGIELGTGLGPVSVIRAVLPEAQGALLTGPSFAEDIARGLPTALTLACAEADCARDLQAELTTANLRLYRSTDVVGAELGGALKNVMAIACGAVMGAGLGDSARAALMTRGYAEMLRLALAEGAQAETMAGLSGFGDLVLTCTSDLSRNYKRGLALGRGEAFDPSITVEGAATARAVAARAAELGLDVPITDTVVALLDETLSWPDAVTRLLSRPLKEE